jgi:RsiW-degrading membrane proteinase PrsW (M82 family)
MGAPESATGLVLRLAVLAVALGPSLPIGAVMASIGRRTMPVGLVGTAFGGGVIAAMLCLLGGMLASLVHLPDGALLKALNDAFLGAAFPEEIAKFAVLVGFVLRHNEAHRGRDAVLLGGWVGLGFAMLENFFYVTSAQEWLITGAVRASLSVPGHVSWGLIMGCFVARAARGEGSILAALGLPILLHGAFDAVLMYRDQVESDPLPTNLVLVILFATVLVSAWALIRWPVCGELARLDKAEPAETRMSDDAAGSVALAAGLSSLVLIALIPLGIAAAGTAAIAVDARYASLVVLSIMPWTFVELWRRA